MIEVTRFEKVWKKESTVRYHLSGKAGGVRCDRREKRLRQIYLNADHGGHFKAGWR